MTTKSGFFQASFSAALAIGLLALASPARAEVVTLICQDKMSSESFTLRVDYDRKIVDFLWPDGTNVRLSAAATITENAVTWYPNNDKPNSNGDFAFMGMLNRLAGEVRMDFTLRSGVNSAHYSGPCRRATQKF